MREAVGYELFNISILIRVCLALTVNFKIKHCQCYLEYCQWIVHGCELYNFQMTHEIIDWLHSK